MIYQLSPLLANHLLGACIGLFLLLGCLLPSWAAAQKTQDICILFQQAVMADPAEPEHYILLNRCLVEGLNEVNIGKRLRGWTDELYRGRHGGQDLFFYAEQPRIYNRLVKQYPDEIAVITALGRYYLEAEMWLNRQMAESGIEHDYPVLRDYEQNYEPILPLCRSGALVRAEQFLKEALRRDPKYAPALAYLAHISFHKARLIRHFFDNSESLDYYELLKIQHEMYRRGISYAEAAIRSNSDMIHAEPLITQGLGNWHVTFYEQLEHAYVAERKIARIILSDAIAALAETDAARRVARVMGVIRHARDLRMAAHFYWELAEDDHAFLTVYPPLQRVDIPQALSTTKEYSTADPETFIIRGLIGQWNGHYLFAAEQYARAVELDPDNFRAQYLQGLMYETAGFLSRALPVYQSLVSRQEVEAADVVRNARERLANVARTDSLIYLENAVKISTGYTLAVLGPHDHLLGLWASHAAPEVTVYVGLQNFYDDFSGNAYLAPGENINRRLQDLPADHRDAETPIPVDCVIISAEGLDAGGLSRLLARVPRRLKASGTVHILFANPETLGQNVLNEMALQAGLTPSGISAPLNWHRAMWHPGHFLSRVATQTDCETFNFAPTAPNLLYDVPSTRVYSFSPAR
jgi:tetratricopeptide (TPR) repeat protein